MQPFESSPMPDNQTRKEQDVMNSRTQTGEARLLPTGVLTPVRWLLVWWGRAKWHHKTARKIALWDLADRCQTAAAAANAGGYARDAARLREVAESLRDEAKKENA